MELNYNPGLNGKRHGTNETILLHTDLQDITDSAVAKDAFTYVAKKKEPAPDTKEQRSLERRAFRKLHKKVEPTGPTGTVGERIPMEIRIKQLSLFPGIY